MDISNATILKSSNFFCKFSPPGAHSAASFKIPKIQLKRNWHQSISFIKIKSWRSYAVPRKEFSPISASFRRHSRRRNSLREKLVGSRESQVRESSEIPLLDSGLQSVDHARDGLGLDTSPHGETAQITNSGKVELSGNSVLWDKLENWVDQYKRDTEFWGIGSGPIFTIHQDSEGTVMRVEVDEDEIIKRSQLRAWSFEKKDGLEEISDAKLKIACAKLIANEFEAGEYVIPRNSSIAKFLVEGKKASLIEGLCSLSLRVEPFVKLFPQIGFTVFCGCCILWVASKLFDKSEKVELSFKEVEMLRRKKKSREREELNKSEVEVVQDLPELPTGVYKRPQLDKKELINSIMQAKTSAENLAIPELSSKFNVENMEFDIKVREIQKMARKAREIERQERAQTIQEGDGDDISSTFLSAKSNSISRNTNAGNNSRTEKLLKDDVAYRSSFEVIGSEKNNSISVDSEEGKMLVESDINSASNAADEEKSKTITDSTNAVATAVDNFKSDVRGSLKEFSVKIGSENSTHDGNTKPEEGILRDEKSKQSTMDTISLPQRETHNKSTLTFHKSHVRSKQKIIKSVKEARQYLAHKHGTSVGKLKSNEVKPVKRAAGDLDDQRGTCNEMINEKRVNTSNAGVIMVEPSQKKLHRDGIAPAAIKPSDQAAIGDISRSKGQAATLCDMLPVKIDHCKKSGDKFGDAQYEILYNKSRKTFYDSDKKGLACSSQKLEKGDTEDSNSLMADSGHPRLNIVNDGQQNNHMNLFYSKKALESLNISFDKPSLNGNSSRSISAIKLEGNDGIPDPQEFSNATDSNHAPGPKTEIDKVGTTIAEDGSKIINDYKISVTGKMAELSTAQMANDSTLDNSVGVKPCSNNAFCDDPKDEEHLNFLSTAKASFLQDSHKANNDSGAKPVTSEKTWLEENFQEFDPIVKKIAVGFRENYMTAREKVQEMSSLSTDISELGLKDGDEELEWMNDEKLRDIVFRVCDNELAGRDPFHLMDADDKQVFFDGLAHKADKVNKKLLGLHEWVHSRVENLDYGADGISLYDPPEKVIPRWKGPSFDKDPDFLKNSMQRRKSSLTGNVEASDGSEDGLKNSLQQAQCEPNPKCPPSSQFNGRGKKSTNVASANPKTLIECSDGSSRAGKRKGKEHWEHTKKWSQGFLEVYNAETDPEIKSIMRDMGKDLDRWLTDKDRQDVADLLSRFTERKRKYFEKKMDKIKREMQMFGTEAVFSKYKEYADEKEEDYLWWLDLDCILCIELYTIEDGNPRVGFYSLEMAADLDLNPKQYHVIAFEDAGDSKNFCYIIQAHMDMLGNGKAFVIPRPPKDAFREAKANGFNVTVIRKREIKLNVDQTLEEVEEEVVEIGSKIYHDKIMHERRVDVRSLMKGVINADKSAKRSRKVLKKPTRS